MKEQPSSLQIQETRLLAEERGKFMRVAFRQRRRDGEWQPRKREVYDNGNSAAIMPYDPTRKTVLLARQLRLPIFLQDGLERSIEACAGKLEGETPEACIIREMQEELGYRVSKVELLFTLCPSPATVMEKITLFTCTT